MGWRRATAANSPGRDSTPMTTFTFQSQLACSAQVLYDYHSRPGAFERLNPPGSPAQVLRAQGGIEDGAERLLALKWGPIRRQWLARHCDHTPGAGFTDVMIKGPLRSWRHDHLFLPESQGSVLLDRIQYDVPFAPLLAPILRRQLSDLFRFRHARTRMDIARQLPYLHLPEQEIVLCGRPNPFSQKLAAFLATAGHRVYQLGYDHAHRARHVFRDCFTGEVSHPLADAQALIYTGFVPRPHIDGPEDELAFWDFLDRVLRTLNHKPNLFLNIDHQRVPTQELEGDLAINQAGRLRHYRINEQNSQMLEVMSEHAQRSVSLHLATTIGETLPQWVDTLLYLESFLFLEHGATTPEFDWIALDDVFAAVLHVLANPSISGDFSVMSATSGTRAEFQMLLLKRHLWRSSWLRMLRVQPGAKPGHPAALRADLKHLRSLADTGFRPLITELSQCSLAQDFAQGRLS